LCLAIAQHGKPHKLRTDNEAVLNSWLFNAFLKIVGIQHQTTQKHAPWQNGRIERLFGTLKPLLRQLVIPNGGALQNALDEFRVFYNHVRPHQNLNGLTPAEHFAVAQANGHPANANQGSDASASPSGFDARLLDQEVDQSEPVFKSTQTALSARGRGNACASGSFCAKSRHSAVLKSAATQSKTSPERQVFEKTGVEIQRQTCRGHLDMTVPTKTDTTHHQRRCKKAALRPRGGLLQKQVQRIARDGAKKQPIAHGVGSYKSVAAHRQRR
jgi:hypothetical protein